MHRRWTGDCDDRRTRLAGGAGILPAESWPARPLFLQVKFFEPGSRLALIAGRMPCAPRIS